LGECKVGVFLWGNVGWALNVKWALFSFVLFVMFGHCGLHFPLWDGIGGVDHMVRGRCWVTWTLSFSKVRLFIYSFIHSFIH
jgi:hypothetical protein